MTKITKKEHFADRLIAAIKAKGTPICVGLDPRLDHIPGFIRARNIKEKGRTLEAAADAIVEFNKGIIDAVAEVVPVVKPQFAFYLQYGQVGVRAFEETCAYAQKKGLLVIADAKCNDIGSTAEAYAHGFLGQVEVFEEKMPSPFECDAVTVTPYLGYDGIKPFLDTTRLHGKGVFILVKTSNPSSGDLQDRMTEDKLRYYELVAHFVESWGADEVGKSGYSSLGAVVGATYPKEAKRLREIMPNAFFLVPGYGAQGGTAADVAHAFNKDGMGALVNSSRDIIFAWEKSDGDERSFGDAAREAVLNMKKDLAKVL